MTKPALPPGGGGAPPVPPKEKEGSAEAKFAKEMRQAVAPLAPAVLTLIRKGDLVVLEAKQAGLKTVSARAINVLIDAAVKQMMAPRGAVGSTAPNRVDDIPDKP